MRTQKKIGDTMKVRFLIALITCSLGVLAQSTNIRAVVSQSEVGLYETFNYAVIMTAGGSDYSPPNNLTDNFTIVGGPHSQSNFSMMNGTTTAIQKVVYELRAKRLGEFTISPASLERGDEIYQSNSVDIRVVDNPQPQYDDNDPRAIAARSAEIRIIPTKLRVYEGESFGIAYKVYSRYRLQTMDEISEPEYDSFLVERIEEDIQARDVSDEQGARYEYNFRTYSMTATQAGEYEFDPYVVNLPMAYRRNRFSMGADFVDNIERAYHPDIEVIPLPREGRPDEFSGGVGDLEFEVVLSRSEVPVDESATIEIIIRGRGNLRSIELPELQLPDQLEVYAPKDDLDIQATPYGPKGKISRKYTLVPRYPGTYEIPPLEFVYFDPIKEQYIVSQSDVQEIVSEGDAPVVSTPRTTTSSTRTEGVVDQRDVELLNEDIRWIHTSDVADSSRGKFYTSTWFIGGMGGSALFTAWLLLAGTVKRWNKARYNAIRVEGKRALGHLRKSNEWSEAHLALSEFLEHGMGVHKAEQIDPFLQSKLETEGVTSEDAHEIYSLLATCEAGQYGQANQGFEETKSSIIRWIQKQLS